MRVPFLIALAVVSLTGCGEPDVDKPSMVAAPKIARDVLKVTPNAYPLDKCVVCGEKLGEPGNPCVFIHEGTEVHLCRDECKKGFLEDPEKYIGMIRDARAGK